MLSPIFNLVVTSAFGVSKDVILITSLRPDTQMYTEKSKTEKETLHTGRETSVRSKNPANLYDRELVLLYYCETKKPAHVSVTIHRGLPQNTTKYCDGGKLTK